MTTVIAPVVIPDLELPADVLADLRFDPSSIPEALVTQHERYLRYALRAAEARGLRDQAYELLDIIYAKLEPICREICQSAAGGKTTEEAVKQAIRRHPQYVEAVDIWSMYNAEHERALRLEKAFDMRAQMLINLSATQRREFPHS